MPIIHSSFLIHPINDVREGIKRGRYTDVYYFINPQTVPLPYAKGEKRVHVGCFDTELKEDEYSLRLGKIGLKPCEYAPNYLLGLMAQVSEEEMPQELRGRYILA